MAKKRLTFFGACAACIVIFAEWNQAATAADGQAKPVVEGLTAEDQTALDLGRKVIAVRKAIEQPQAPGSLQAVKDLGLDSRYYVMVRGWLSQQLQADASIRDASKGNTPQKIKDRIAFLERAIRAIDLE